MCERPMPATSTAVQGINLAIGDGEMVVLVGPSGCGKSTLLRMIAGLETITSGTISIDGRVVNKEEPAERDIAMVFQNYALYPHMTRPPEPRIRAQEPRHAAPRDRPTGRRSRAHPRDRALPRPPASPAFGWPAPARRDGSGHRAPAQGFPLRRAALEPRCETSWPDARRNPPLAADPAHYQRLCHP